MKKTFNLLREPWILARKGSKGEKLSLIEAFSRAHEMRALCGETIMQDVAIIRLMLAILHAVYGSSANTPENAVALWGELWKAGKFDSGKIEKYLMQYEERFWLFHPTFPFYQVSELEGGSEYPTKKLIGDIAESGNKKNLFSGRTGDSIKSIEFDEAARWLLHLIAFDDNSGKPTRGKNLPSAGVGWLGQIGIIFPEGKTLFETLMLNFHLLDISGTPHPSKKPYWELQEIRSEERTVIPAPVSPVELFTAQSRRVKLLSSGSTVSGYRLMGGDIFDSTNVQTEIMTAWDERDDGSYIPRKHREPNKIWVNIFSSMDQNAWLPIVIKHFSGKVRFRVCGILYNYPHGSSIVDTIDENYQISTFLLHSDALKKLDCAIKTIATSIFSFGFLVKELSFSEGARDINTLQKKKENAQELMFSDVGDIVKEWLRLLDDISDLDAVITALFDKVHEHIANAGKTRLERSAPKSILDAVKHYNLFENAIFSQLKKKKSVLISIAEYAEIHGVKQNTVRQGCLRGRFKTAQKIGRNWLINSDEPYVDNREKDGKYKDWRKK